MVDGTAVKNDRNSDTCHFNGMHIQLSRKWAIPFEILPYRCVRFVKVFHIGSVFQMELVRVNYFETHTCLTYIYNLPQMSIQKEVTQLSTVKWELFTRFTFLRLISEL